MLDAITPVILTYNEADNIVRALAGLGWAREIVVVDSGSTDGTLDILKNHPRVRLFHRDFDNHFGQWSFAVFQTGIVTPWFLRLDADYVLPEDFVREIVALDPDALVSAYIVSFDYAVMGRRLIASLYPPKPLLFRLDKCAVTDLGHTEGWRADGALDNLHTRVLHDDRKPFSRWLSSQQKYAEREAAYLLNSEYKELNFADRLRLMAWPAPFLVAVYTLFAKKCLFDGWAGWFYVLQRVLVEIVIALEIIDRQNGAPRDHGRQDS